MVSKKNDLPMDFDLEKIKQTTKENEIFYIQYAYSRASSVLDGFKNYNPADFNINYSLLINDYEIDFIKKALEYPKIIQVALKNLEPHHICFYLYALAGEFHKVWHFGNESKDRRFIIENDQNLTKTRLLIPYFLKIIVESAFEIVGIQPMKKM